MKQQFLPLGKLVGKLERLAALALRWLGDAALVGRAILTRTRW